MGKSLWQEDYGDVGAVLKRLQVEGVTTHDLARLRSDDRQNQIAGQALKAGRNPRVLRPNTIIALEPFGPAIFGPEDWLRLYDMGPDCYTATRFPWSTEVLNGPCPFYPDKTVAETHFAFQGSPLYHQILTNTDPALLTIRQWMRLHPHAEQSKRRFYQSHLPWASAEPFMSAVVEPRWYLMLRNPVPGSENLSYQAQVESLPPEYEVPSAVEAVTMMILAIEKSRICCCANQFGRVRDTTVDGERIRLDLHSQDMIPGHIGIYRDQGEANEPAGILVSRLLPRSVRQPSESLSVSVLVTDGSVRIVEFLNALPEPDEIKIAAFQGYLSRAIGMTEAEFEAALSMSLANNLVQIRHRRRTGTTLRLSPTGKIIRDMEQTTESP